MKRKGRIPIAAAQRIAEDAEQDMVIIFGLKRSDTPDASGKFQLTTYGVTKKLCKLAGSLADQIAEHLASGAIAPTDAEPPGGGDPICEERNVQ